MQTFIKSITSIWIYILNQKEQCHKTVSCFKNDKISKSKYLSADKKTFPHLGYRLGPHRHENRSFLLYKLHNILYQKNNTRLLWFCVEKLKYFSPEVTITDAHRRWGSTLSISLCATASRSSVSLPEPWPLCCCTAATYQYTSSLSIILNIHNGKLYSCSCVPSQGSFLMDYSFESDVKIWIWTKPLIPEWMDSKLIP